MSSKRQFLNLYAPSNLAATKFMVQQKADEAFFSREDKKMRFYAPDFVIRKKKTLVAEEEDLSVFDEFVAQKAEYDGYNSASVAADGVLTGNLAALIVTVNSNKTSGDAADSAEVSARTLADTAIVATQTSNKSAQDAGFAAATAARASDKAELVASIAAEAATRLSADNTQATNLSSLLANTDPAAVDSISEVIA